MEQIGLYKDGQIYDLLTAKELELQGGETILNDDSQISLEILRHTTAHMMAQAIGELYTNAKFFVGPVIKDGFYYDFKTDETIGEEDLPKIEKAMKKIASQKLKIQKYTTTKEKITQKFCDDELKLEVLKNITDEKLTIYKQGEFEDLCRGPHLPNTSMARYFKLIRVAGAYLGGDETNEMITRIYGIAFFDKQKLKEYEQMLIQAKKRDHRKLGSELKLFTFSDNIGAGLPLWLPAGARLREKIERLLYKAHRARGYEPVRAPEILKANAWIKSGHYENYKENMYFTTIDNQEYGLKPMNCVGHIEVFANHQISYRDLPLKYFEYGVVHRHELSGVMHGLFRVREFTQDDAHIFCMENQIKDVIYEVLEFVESLMGYFEFDYEMEVSTKPKKAIGSDEFWQTTTNSIQNALDEGGYKYTIDEGGGAFYGPKIDIKILDAIGRKWQCGTIQIDMNLPQRFDISYTSNDDKKVRPVMIHRAILGSFERFIGILIEHTAGELPFAISPTSVVFIPIANEHIAYCQDLAQKLRDMDIDSEIFTKNESLNKKIRVAEKQKSPMIVVVGDEEVQNSTIALRDRRTKTKSNISKEIFINMIKKELRKAKI
ncbi:MAG: threonine--tRNA ligase [Campylobacteraceae bacterium 4484_166]|nr:MAG: threonine--tRNA ligase [Campylobacteraceae bacterium 4484_166]